MEVYDCLSDTWEVLPSMATRRHGATACKLNGKVYVMGGMYVDERPVPVQEKFCDVLDLGTGDWTSLPLSAYRHLPMDEDILDNSAFFGAAAVSGRIVARMGDVTLAYNPSMPEDGWRAVVADSADVKVGGSSCCTSWGCELIVASGRPTPFARQVAAFRFHKSASDPLWYHGAWRQLPELQYARVGGAMAVMDGLLYITGGVCESTGQFQDTAERLDSDGQEWRSVPWFKMPRALHAHDAFALPYVR